MGNWTIVIEGTGPHHNQQTTDAEQMADAFVRDLLRYGHTVQHASVTCASRQLLNREYAVMPPMNIPDYHLRHATFDQLVAELEHRGAVIEPSVKATEGRPAKIVAGPPR